MGYGTLRFLQNLKSVYEIGADQRPAMWRTWIGINHTSGSQHGKQGTVVLSVSQPSPAQQAGLLPGDFITELNGKPTRNYDDFETMLNECMLQDVLTLVIWRDGQLLQFHCGIAPYPKAYSA
jgi:S1-C subfamily serine protease